MQGIPTTFAATATGSTAAGKKDTALVASADRSIAQLTATVQELVKTANATKAATMAIHSSTTATVVTQEVIIRRLDGVEATIRNLGAQDSNPWSPLDDGPAAQPRVDLMELWRRIDSQAKQLDAILLHLQRQDEMMTSLATRGASAAFGQTPPTSSPRDFRSMAFAYASLPAYNFHDGSPEPHQYSTSLPAFSMDGGLDEHDASGEDGVSHLPPSTAFSAAGSVMGADSRQAGAALPSSDAIGAPASAAVASRAGDGADGSHATNTTVNMTSCC